MRLARPSLTAITVLLACLVVAGCASSATAGWTFAPPPSATPVPAASAGASGSPTTSAAPSGPTADVSLSALNIAFDKASVNAPAGKAFTLLFDNQDASVPHDVWIKDSGGTHVFEGAIVTGPGQLTYNVPSLAAGTYTFFCSIHANMTGTMVVQ